MRAGTANDEHRDLAARRRTTAAGVICAIAVSEISTGRRPAIDLVEGSA